MEDEPNIDVLERQMEDLGFQSLARTKLLPDWHHAANYNIVHPESGELDRMPFRPVIETPYGGDLLVLHEFDWCDSLTEYHLEGAAKYLSFETSADLLSYVNVVVPDIVGPAVEIMAFGKADAELFGTLSEFIDSTSTQEWLEKLFNSLVEPKLVPVTAMSEDGNTEICPKLFILAHAIQLLRFAPVHFRRNNSHKTTDSYTRRFPIGFPQPTFNRPVILGGYSFDDLLRTTFGWVTERPEVIFVNLPVPALQLRFNRLFPFMKFPPEVRLMIIESALPTQIAPCIRGYDPDDGVDTVSFCAIYATHEDTILPLKLSCRYIYNAIRQLRPVKAVDKYNDEVTFRFDFKQDTLRVFDYGIPCLRTTSGQELPLPVQKLMVMTDRPEFEHPIEWEGVALKRVMSIHRFPWLKEFSMVSPVAGKEWRIEGFERDGPEVDISRTVDELWGSDRNRQLGSRFASLMCASRGIPAHMGVKWKFNYHDNYSVSGEAAWNTPEGECLGVPPGFCEDADSQPDGRLERQEWFHNDNRAFIPYIGFYGYDRGQCSMGGNWAGFRYFEETGAVFFTPLSWDDVEPLVVGPHGENGEKAPWNEHYPQFVARVWIIRKGESVPEGQGQYGWMRVEEVMDGDPEWKQQLKSTWMMVRDTFEAEYHHNCGYEFRDTRF
ncbi:hypothetical protein FDENT_7723 [Fusarium denticulatum]|uniref:Uncharacterized protein n=1 Tax=Fusarium denticulatum TaxID=48507 RepID=A0A8H5X3X0_9HYPO|nr:hypothetical protein FDENT_7723 [Fusarium denticulatum]